MSLLQEFLAMQLFERPDCLYRAFVHAVGAEVNGPPTEESDEQTEKEFDLQCIIPRVLNIVREAEVLVSEEIILGEERSGLRANLNEVLRASRHDIGALHSELLQLHPIARQVNGYDKYPELMREIEDTEKIFPRLRLPEPFDLPPLPVCPAPQHYLNYDYNDVPLPGRSYIRLVRVNLTTNNNRDVSMRAVDLCDNPSYGALSYTWGPPLNVFRTEEERRKTQSQLDDPLLQVTVPITCNGNALHVTENLFRFLCRWREGLIHAPFEGRSGENREIWIDVICINQNDLDEKNIQVSKMGDIYSKSQGVYIWLGEEDCFSRIAIPLLYKLAAFEGDWNSLRELGARGAERELLDRGLPPILSSDFMCVFAFSRRAWFRRAWICQEVAFAQELSVFCGGVNIPDWRFLTNSVTYLYLTGLTATIDRIAWSEIRGIGLVDTTRSALGMGTDLNTPIDLSPPGGNPDWARHWQSVADFLESAIRDVTLFNRVTELSQVVVMHTIAESVTDKVIEIYYRGVDDPNNKIEVKGNLARLDESVGYVLIACGAANSDEKRRNKYRRRVHEQVFEGKAKGVHHFHGTRFKGTNTHPSYAKHSEGIQLEYRRDCLTVRVEI
ncbi:heterokaryon incompatibility protein-domain-containing protein [Xylaria bambusicola]|uniref:heterokaryon incompatibility protein-domain-containing protein n=1 Tax=Xylaria bambusicola TaxID=326684 RepID=UPI0020082D30|nr:heterokaryon incompatibility protein-domain-containing protein [Xylaria bambusicola]KAI0514722.1 heterokaryon incompatibility protein-domain-containing protein [Xylaria bambusicola]